MEIVALIISIIGLMVSVLIGVKQYTLQKKQVKIDNRPYVEALYKSISIIVEASVMYGATASYLRKKPYENISAVFEAVNKKFQSDINGIEVNLHLGKHYITHKLCQMVDEIWEKYNDILKNIVPFLFDILDDDEKNCPELDFKLIQVITWSNEIQRLKSNVEVEINKLLK